MNLAKETPNKLRWDVLVEGAPFELYIPKWRVPRPWPRRIVVRLSEVTDETLDAPLPQEDRVGSAERSIVAVVERQGSHADGAVRTARE
jgi:hypothetical protein